MTQQRPSNNNNNTVTLRNLTAFNALEERETMLELFNLVDTSAIDRFKLCYDNDKQKTLLESFKSRVDTLKNGTTD